MTDLHRPIAVPRPSPPTVAQIREAPPAIRLDGDRFRVALGLAVALAVAIRAWHVLSQDFPLNDGGLFYAMARDIQAAGYRLPTHTSYNGDGIPFGYSPLGFYLAALLDQATTLTLTDALRWIPLMASCLVVVVFAALARAILAGRAAVVAAVLAFAVVPRSFLWLVMGGGLTRSLGLLFALTTLWLLLRLYTRRDWRLVPLAGLTAGLTLLSHLGTAPFAAFSAILLWLAYGRHRAGTLGTLAAAAIALVVSAPWWYTVLAHHGPGPFVAAMATGGSIFQRIDLRQALTTLAASGLGTGEPVLGLVGMLAVVGFFFSLTSRDWLFPAWWVTIVALDARQGSTFSTVPVSMLAGVALVQVLLPAMRRAWGLGAASTLRRSPGRHGWSPAVVAGLFLLFGAGTALLRLPALAGDLPNLKGLSPGEREAMAWVATETPESSGILVVGGTPWEIDR
ncbi:MAG TPA: glycosyltransferase family 39 protein, partial [Gemmatimonadales bacterium]|nr:glycosyltransferase family 39 protein [Gemmatimonadales bacterium]